MGGRMSRNKGARGERSLVMHLRLLGYDARRVIRTRAVKGYENDVVPDVVIHEGGEIKYTFESKVRKDSFGTIYKLYEKERNGSVYRFTLPTQERICVAIGSDFEEVKRAQDVHFRSVSLEGSEETRAHLRLVRLKEMLKGAQFLVIKDNNCYPLFIRFWT